MTTETLSVDFNPWCGDCVERKWHVVHEAGARQALHLEREHSYSFGPSDDPLAAPYALDQLHRELHARGQR